MKIRAIVVLVALVGTGCGAQGAADKTASAPASAPAQTPAPQRSPVAAKKIMTVYKSPTCGCCEKWVEHMAANGYDVKTIDVEDVDTVKRTYGVPASVQSCHTALVDGFVVEGHVPAETVTKFLRERSALAGIAVGGMPIGSPGMEVPQGIVEPYIVSSFDKKGQTAVYEKRE